MEVGKVIKVNRKNYKWDFIRWSKKYEMKFPSTLCSFKKTMQITRWMEYYRIMRRKKEEKAEKLQILALKSLIVSGRVKCEKTYLKEFNTWYHTWTLCTIIAYDFIIDNMFNFFIRSDLNVQHCSKCLNVTIEENVLCKKCGKMNVFLRNKDVIYS